MHNLVPWVAIRVHRLYTRALSLLVVALCVALYFVSSRTVIDREVASSITRGCAYYEDILYLREGDYASPVLVDVGADLIPGISSVPSFVKMRHWTGWFAWRDVVIYSMKSVRCVLANVQR